MGYLGRRREKKATTRHQSPDREMRGARATLSPAPAPAASSAPSIFSCVGILCIRQESTNKCCIRGSAPPSARKHQREEEERATPCWNFWNRKRKFPGVTCCSLKHPSATSALCYDDVNVNVNGGGEGPPALGKTPEPHRISRCFPFFQQTPDPVPLRDLQKGEGGEREPSARRTPKSQPV